MLLALLCDILIFVIIQVKYNDYVSVLDVTEISYATSSVVPPGVSASNNSEPETLRACEHIYSWALLDMTYDGTVCSSRGRRASPYKLFVILFYLLTYSS